MKRALPPSRKLELKMNLGERLKQVRDSLGYTQKEIAKAINTNPQTWQVYESGKSVPGGNVLEALARMGFNVNWILTGVGPRKLNEEEMKRLVCEEEHVKLRKRIAERIQRSKPMIVDIYADIPGLDYEDVVAYAYGEKQLNIDQLPGLCRRSGSPFFDDDFIEKITRVDLSNKQISEGAFNGSVSQHATAQSCQGIDEELLKSAIQAVEEYLQEMKGTLPPDKKSELVLLICKLHAGKTTVEKATVLSLVKLAAA